MWKRNADNRVPPPGLRALIVTGAALWVVLSAPGGAREPDSPETGEGSTTSAPAKVSNADVANAVREELSFDPIVSASQLKVQARDGTVTLQGEARSLLAKERAERIAETVMGVRAVDNRIVVRPAVVRDAAELSRLIELNMQQDPVVESFEITVLVTGAGDVTLRGTVDSWTERLFVGNAAKRVIGVRSVNNEIEIQPGTARLDSDVRADVLGKLRWDAYIDASDIDASVVVGAVRLSGSVRSAAEKRRAASLAWGPGVKSVSVNSLLVVPSERAAHRPLATNMRARAGGDVAEVIAAKYAIDPRLSNADVSVDVDRGVVTLSGSVRDLRARRAATALAYSTSGAREVRNRLDVRPLGRSPSGPGLRNQVEQALERDAITTAADIDVRVDAGTVQMRGKVESPLVAAAAEHVASGVRDVVAVENLLEIDRGARPYVPDPFVDDPGDFENRAGEPVSGDRHIEQSIRKQFWWSPFVDQTGVAVSVNGGVATLTGVVGTLAEKSAAEENALEGGAVAVVNRLQVAE